MIKNLILGFGFTCLISCSSRLDKEEYIRWVHDYGNGLHVNKTSNEFVFDLQYQPTEYAWLQRGGANSGQSVKDLQNTQYYILTIGLNDPAFDFMNYNIQDANEKQRKQYYFSYLFQQDIQLEENGTVLPCVLYHFERPVDLKHSRTFVLGFENPNNESTEAKLIINSTQFGSLPIKVKISKENIPSLNV